MDTELLKNTKGFLSFERLTKGPWQAFERALARLLAHKGWEVYDVVGGAGDKGADIIAAYKGSDRIFQLKFSERNAPLSVDIVGDVKRAIEFYGIPDGVCVSNRPLGDQQQRKLKVLQDQGYNISTFTGRSILNSYEALPEWALDEKTLRPYQHDALDNILSSFLNNEGRGLVALATGLGKTYVAACFLRWLFSNYPSNNVLVLADKRELLLQFDKAIWTNLPKSVATHILYEAEKPSFLEGVLLSTFQSFEKFYTTNADLHFDIVIVDEAHHGPADTYKEVLKALQPKYLLGLTATPFRSDDKSVTDIFGRPLVKYGVVRAMRKGFLSEVEYRIKNDNVDKDWISRNSEKGYTIRQLNKKLFIPERDETICSSIIDYWKFKKCKRGIIFCNSTTHAHRIEKLLRSSYDFPVRALTTRVEKKDRVRRIRLFRNGDIKILTCYDMLNEGIDVPDVDILVYLRVTHSRIIFLQQLGRGLRYIEGKTLLVLDYVADIRRIKEVQRFKTEYDDYKDNMIEELHLPKGFDLAFSDNDTASFLNLVTKDESEIEDMDIDDEVYISRSDE